MKILVTGATGLIGSALVKHLQQRGHSVQILTRKKTGGNQEFFWNPEENYIDDDAFAGIDSIIHLAGATIAQRWTARYKTELLRSRIDTAHLLLNYCEKHEVKLKSFISSSGINYYGSFTSDEILTEETPVRKNDFLAQLSQQWEDAAYRFSQTAERTVCLRTAMVLAKEGGSFVPLKKLTDLHLASPVGSGKQWMNWIHIEDLVSLYTEALENDAYQGSYNAVADETVRNSGFMRSMAKNAGKFFLPLPVPGFILKLLMGEMSSIILEGTRASNEKVKRHGFSFKYGRLNKALASLM